MNKGEIRTAVRDEISEPTPGFVSNTEIDRWTNRANYDLAEAAGMESGTSTTVTTVSGTESYDLASDFGLVDQVELVDASDPNAFDILQPKEHQERQDQTGKPAGYYVLAGKLYVVPKPDGVYTLRVWYLRTGVTLTADGDTPIVPARYHDLITLFDISQAKRKGDDPAYLTYLQDYVAGREGMVAFLRKRGQGGRFHRVVDVYED